MVILLSAKESKTHLEGRTALRGKAGEDGKLFVIIVVHLYTRERERAEML